MEKKRKAWEQAWREASESVRRGGKEKGTEDVKKLDEFKEEINESLRN